MIMKIGLIDVDGHNFPNIPLMKLSAWHKSHGDEVGWYDGLTGRYDIVYKSKVFSFTRDYPYAVNAERVIEGGSGYALLLKDGREVYSYDESLPDEVEHTYPDYSLYPKFADTAFGFLTRGCPRACSFCHVAAKEGRRSYKVADLQEFWDGQRNIVLCDPNILACKDWRELLQQLIDSGATVDINQGLDIRLMTEEKVEMLNSLKSQGFHFAWDRYSDKDTILPKFEMVRKGLRTHKHSSIVYVLVNYDSTFEQDLERVYTLRDMGYWPYIMIYDKEHASQEYRRLSRWTNNRVIFAVCKRFEDYDGKH